VRLISNNIESNSISGIENHNERSKKQDLKNVPTSKLETENFQSIKVENLTQFVKNLYQKLSHSGKSEIVNVLNKLDLIEINNKIEFGSTQPVYIEKIDRADPPLIQQVESAFNKLTHEQILSVLKLLSGKLARHDNDLLKRILFHINETSSDRIDRPLVELPAEEHRGKNQLNSATATKAQSHESEKIDKLNSPFHATKSLPVMNSNLLDLVMEIDTSDEFTKHLHILLKSVQAFESENSAQPTEAKLSKLIQATDHLHPNKKIEALFEHLKSQIPESKLVKLTELLLNLTSPDLRLTASDTQKIKEKLNAKYDTLSISNQLLTNSDVSSHQRTEAEKVISSIQKFSSKLSESERLTLQHLLQGISTSESIIEGSRNGITNLNHLEGRNEVMQSHTNSIGSEAIPQQETVYNKIVSLFQDIEHQLSASERLKLQQLLVELNSSDMETNTLKSLGIANAELKDEGIQPKSNIQQSVSEQDSQKSIKAEKIVSLLQKIKSLIPSSERFTIQQLLHELNYTDLEFKIFGNHGVEKVELNGDGVQAKSYAQQSVSEQISQQPIKTEKIISLLQKIEPIIPSSDERNKLQQLLFDLKSSALIEKTSTTHEAVKIEHQGEGVQKKSNVPQNVSEQTSQQPIKAEKIISLLQKMEPQILSADDRNKLQQLLLDLKSPGLTDKASANHEVVKAEPQRDNVLSKSDTQQNVSEQTLQRPIKAEKIISLLQKIEPLIPSSPERQKLQQLLFDLKSSVLADKTSPNHEAVQVEPQRDNLLSKSNIQQSVSDQSLQQPIKAEKIKSLLQKIEPLIPSSDERHKLQQLLLDLKSSALADKTSTNHEAVQVEPQRDNLLSKSGTQQNVSKKTLQQPIKAEKIISLLQKIEPLIPSSPERLNLHKLIQHLILENNRPENLNKFVDLGDTVENTASNYQHQNSNLPAAENSENSMEQEQPASKQGRSNIHLSTNTERHSQKDGSQLDHRELILDEPDFNIKNSKTSDNGNPYEKLRAIIAKTELDKNQSDKLMEQIALVRKLESQSSDLSKMKLQNELNKLRSIISNLVDKNGEINDVDLNQKQSNPITASSHQYKINEHKLPQVFGDKLVSAMNKLESQVLSSSAKKTSDQNSAVVIERNTDTNNHLSESNNSQRTQMDKLSSQERYQQRVNIPKIKPMTSTIDEIVSEVSKADNEKLKEIVYKLDLIETELNKNLGKSGGKQVFVPELQLTNFNDETDESSLPLNIRKALHNLEHELSVRDRKIFHEHVELVHHSEDKSDYKIKLTNDNIEKAFSRSSAKQQSQIDSNDLILKKNQQLQILINNLTAQFSPAGKSQLQLFVRELENSGISLVQLPIPDVEINNQSNTLEAEKKIDFSQYANKDKKYIRKIESSAHFKKPHLPVNITKIESEKAEPVISETDNDRQIFFRCKVILFTNGNGMGRNSVILRFQPKRYFF